jgi:hypothetical protein
MSDHNPKGGESHQQTDANQRTAGKESTKRHVYVEPGTQIDFVKDLRDKYDAAQEQNTSHSGKILFWTKVSAVLLFIYAALAAWQGHEMRKTANTALDANRLAEKNMGTQFALTRSQQRAYIEIVRPPEGVMKALPKLAEIKYLTYPVTIKNVGRSVASSISYQMQLEVPKANEEPSFTYHNYQYGTIGPFVPDSPPEVMEAHEYEEPGGPGMLHPLTDEVRRDLKDGTRYVVVFGQIRYQDVFGAWWMQFCMWRPYVVLPVGKAKQFSTPKCVAYNTEGGTPKTEPQ